MKLRFWILSIFAVLILSSPALWAQDLGPGFTKVKDGIYVFASKEGNSTCSIILTEEGVVIIDSCQTPMDGRALMVGVKKLTDKPIRFLIDTEVHSDHTFDHFIFSPPAVVINREGAGAGMKKNTDPKRVETLAAQSPEMREAVQGYRMVTPHIEYKDKMTINLGEPDLRAVVFEKRSQRSGYGDLAAERASAFRRIRSECEKHHQSPTFCYDPGRSRQLQADEIAEPGSRRARSWSGEHHENFRRI